MILKVQKPQNNISFNLTLIKIETTSDSDQNIILGTVYNLGVSEGDYTDWEFMFEQYKKELVADEKVRHYVLIGK